MVRFYFSQSRILPSSSQSNLLGRILSETLTGEPLMSDNMEMKGPGTEKLRLMYVNPADLAKLSAIVYTVVGVIAGVVVILSSHMIADTTL